MENGSDIDFLSRTARLLGELAAIFWLNLFGLMTGAHLFHAGRYFRRRKFSRPCNFGVSWCCCCCWFRSGGSDGLPIAIFGYALARQNDGLICSGRSKAALAAMGCRRWWWRRCRAFGAASGEFRFGEAAAAAATAAATEAPSAILAGGLWRLRFTGTFSRCFSLDTLFCRLFLALSQLDILFRRCCLDRSFRRVRLALWPGVAAMIAIPFRRAGIQIAIFLSLEEVADVKKGIAF